MVVTNLSHRCRTINIANQYSFKATGNIFRANHAPLGGCFLVRCVSVDVVVKFPISLPRAIKDIRGQACIYLAIDLGIKERNAPIAAGKFDLLVVIFGFMHQNIQTPSRVANMSLNIAWSWNKSSVVFLKKVRRRTISMAYVTIIVRRTWSFGIVLNLLASVCVMFLIVPPVLAVFN